jgi:hypothetical protein
MSDRAWAGRSMPAAPNPNRQRAAQRLATQGRQLVSLDAADRALIREALAALAATQPDTHGKRCLALAASKFPRKRDAR